MRDFLRKNQYFICFGSLFLLLLSFCFSAFADQAPSNHVLAIEEVTVISDYFINPVYPHSREEYLEVFDAVINGKSQSQVYAFQSGSDSAGAGSEGTEEETLNPDDFLSYTEGMEILRTGLINRETSITVKFESGALKIGGVVNLINMLARHTGNPQGGDYIYFHLSSAYTKDSTSVKVNDVYYNTYTLCVKYYTTAEQEAYVGSVIASALADMDIDAPFLTAYDKVLAIYEYIDDHVVYDYSHTDDTSYTPQFTAYAALHDGKCVCQGFANLFYRMCLTAGLDARIISGNNHAWNTVKVGSGYYTVDITWDDSRGTYEYNYFLLSIENCGKSGWDDSRGAAAYNYCTMASNNYPCSAYLDNSNRVNALKHPAHVWRGTLENGVCSECGVSRDLVYTHVLHLPNSLQTIEAESFAGISAEAVVIPESCTSIESGAFASCPYLKLVILPSDDVEVHENAFLNISPRIAYR